MRSHTSTPISSSGSVASTSSAVCSEHGKELEMFCNQCEKTVCNVCCFEGKCSEHQKKVEMVSKVGVRHVDMLRQQMEELGAVQHSIAQQLARVEALMQGAWGGGILCTPSASMSCFSETVLIDAVGSLSLHNYLSPIPTQSARYPRSRRCRRSTAQ